MVRLLFRAAAAPRATPTPRRNGVDKFKGKFDYGWDKAARDYVSQEQKELEVIPREQPSSPPPAKRTSCVGRPVRGCEAGVHPPDGELRRLSGLCRRSDWVG